MTMDFASIKRCTEIYVGYAERYGKLPKSLKESLNDFQALYGESVQNCTSYEVGVLFNAYLVDYLPFSAKTERPEKVEKAEKVEKVKPLSQSEQARALRADGFSYAEIGKRLGVSDKTAKKLCEN